MGLSSVLLFRCGLRMSRMSDWPLPAACISREVSRCCSTSSGDASVLRDKILRQKFATRLKIVHLDVITNIH